MKKNYILFLILVLFIVGCSQQNNSHNNPIKEETLILNNYGRQLIINRTPEKVLTLGPNCTELMIALGLEDLIIGNTLNNHSRGALDIYKEAYDKIPELNHGEATREAVLSSGADFIYGIDWEFGDSALNIEELNDFGIDVYVNSATSLDEIFEEIRDLGKIFNVEDQAESFIEEQKQRISVIEELSFKQGKKVNVLVYDSGNDGVFTASGSNFESLLIELAGGHNIFSDLNDKQWLTVSYESILERNPDVIIIHDYDSPSITEKINEIKANPVLSTLDCVKNERFVIISLESVLPGSRMAHTVELLYQGFYE